MKAKKEKNRLDDSTNEHRTLIPPNPPTKSILPINSNNNPLLMHNPNRNSPSTINGNNPSSNLVAQLSDISTVAPIGIDPSSASAFSSSLMTSSASTPTSLMMMDDHNNLLHQHSLIGKFNILSDYA